MRRVILALVGVCSLALGAAAWHVDIVGTGTRSTDTARAMAVDAAGHVVIAGVTVNSGTPQDFTVLKVDGDGGAELWHQVIHGTATSTQGSDGANAVAVDAVGNVFAAGQLTNRDTGADFIVVKFDEASGAELWRQTLNGTANGGDRASTVAVDAAGDVIAAGVLSNTGTGGDFTVIKFHGGSGIERWRRSIDIGSGGDGATAVAVDADGNVIAAGVLASSNFAVVKFDGGSGAERWRQAIRGTGSGIDQANAVAVDAAGDVVAAGALTNAGTLTDFAVVKFAGATGAERWRQAINGLANRHEEARTVAVDAVGDVVAAGSVTDDIGRNFSVVKFAGASGAELWRLDIDGSSGDHFASAVALDAAGDVVAAGRLERSEPAGFTVIKVDGASGAERWRQVITGNFFTNFANAVAVNAVGDVVAAGGLATTDRDFDFTAVKLDGASGSELWRQQLNGSSPGINIASAVGVDAAGDVIAAGDLTNADTDGDFTVVKLDGMTGAERWRQELNGAENGFDQVLAMKLDAAGDVIAAGILDRPAVIKFDGVSGAERWRHGLGDALDVIGGFAVSAAGHAVLAGFTFEDGPFIRAFTVVTLDGADGSERWRHAVDVRGEARAVVVDAAGDVIAAGALQPGFSRDFAVVKFDGETGAEVWRLRLSGTADDNDIANAVAVDAAGDVIVAGGLSRPGTREDFTVLKVNGTSGVEVRRQTLSGTANTNDGVSAVAVDAAGDVIAVGSVVNTGAGSVFTVVKFDGTSGAERWRQGIPGDARTVAVDAAGDVVAAGSTTNTDASTSFFTVIKFDGVSGAERWRRDIPALGGCCVVDSAGDVVAAGNIGDNDGSHFTVVKLRGSDGGDFGTNTCQGTGFHRLRGRVRPLLHWRAIPGVTLTLTGPAGCQDTFTTSFVGGYVFRQLGAGTYTLTPARAGCTFIPASRTVTLQRFNRQAQFRGICLATDEGQEEPVRETEGEQTNPERSASGVGDATRPSHLRRPVISPLDPAVALTSAVART